MVEAVLKLLRDREAAAHFGPVLECLLSDQLKKIPKPKKPGEERKKVG